MLRRLSLLITAPLTLAALIFAIANRDPIFVRLWPFQVTVETPLFIVVLGALALGLVSGAAMLWPAALRWRSVAKRRQKRIEQLEEAAKAAAPAVAGLPVKVS